MPGRRSESSFRAPRKKTMPPYRCGIAESVLYLARPHDDRNREREAQPELVPEHGHRVPGMTIVIGVVAGGLVWIRMPLVSGKDIIQVETTRLFRSPLSKQWYRPRVRSSRFRPMLALLILSISLVIAPAVSAFNLGKRPCCAPAASACECPTENPCQASMKARGILPEIAWSFEAKENRSIDGPGYLPARLAESPGTCDPSSSPAGSLERESFARHRLRRLASLRI